MANLTAEAEQFEKFLNDTLRPDYLNAVEKREKLLDECREYEILLLAIQKTLKTKQKSLHTLVNLGQNVFVNAEIDDCSKVIVKMIDDMFLELPAERAITFVENKIKLLSERAERINEIASRIRAHIDLILTSLEDLVNLQK